MPLLSQRCLPWEEPQLADWHRLGARGSHNGRSFVSRSTKRSKPSGALYAEFVDEAARLYGDALGHQKDEVEDLVKIYALIGRIRLVSPRPVVAAAERTLDTISRTYLSPNRSLHEVIDDFQRGGSDFFAEFGEACRQDLGLD